MDLRKIRQRLGEVDWSKTIALLLGIVACSSAAWNWYHPRVVPSTSYGSTPPIPAAANLPTQELPVQRVVVLVKQEAVKALKPPPEITGNPSAQITATAAIPPSPHGGSAIAYINTSTGRSNIVYKAAPQPLFGFPSDVTTGVRYGVTTNDAYQGQLYAKWDFLRIGKAFLGVYGEVTTRPDAKAMIDASVRW